MSTKLATKSITYLNIVIALFILSFALPVGDIYNIPLQNCFLFAFLLLSIFILVQQGKLRDILKNSISEITIFSIGLVWCIISCYFKGNALSIKFFMLLCITITVFLLFSYLTKYHLLDASYVMKSILLMMLLKMLGKFIIELLFIFKFIEYEEIMPLYSTVFHTNAITMTMHFGNLTLARIQTSSDLIVISLIPFFWVLPELSKKIRFTLFVLSGAYAFIVFSRIALAQFGCCAIITLIFYWKTFPKKWKWSGVFAAALSSILWLPSLISMIQFRFFSSFAVESDSTRNIQSAKLIEGISQKPFFGHGMGSFIPDYIRSAALPFSYEKEYLSFIYQLGIIGFILLIGGIIFLFTKHILPRLKDVPFIVQVFGISAILWFLVRPMFNPSFMGLQGGFPVIGVLLIITFFNEYSKTAKRL